MTDEAKKSSWHLDKRVPIALIVAIVMQTATLGAWVGSLQQRVSHNEDAIKRGADQGERLARIEAILEEIKDRLNREGL